MSQIVRMPDGQDVSFPDDMPKEQIRALILSKYPDAAKGVEGGQSQANATDGPSYWDLLKAGGQGVAENIGAFAQSTAQMLTGNLSDEIEASIRSGGVNIGPFKASIWGDYDEELRKVRERMAQNSAAAPIAETLGTITGLALGLGGGLFGSAPALGSNAGLGARALAGAKQGAPIGALYAAGGSEGGIGDRMVSGLVGAGTGAAFGGAIPIVGAGAKSVYEGGKGLWRYATGQGATATQKATSAAGSRVSDAMRMAGVNADDALRGVQEGRTLAQQSPQLSKMARDIRTQGGPAATYIDDALQSGYDASQKSVASTIRQVMSGRENFYTWLREFKKAKVTKAKPLYESVFKSNWGKSGPPFALDDLMPRVPAAAIREAADIAKANGKDFFGTLIASIDDAGNVVKFKRLPTLEEAEYIRRGIDSLASSAYRNGAGGRGEAFSGLANEFRQIINKASPGLKKIRDAYADDYAIERAAEAGKQWLSKSADYIDDAVKQMTRPEKQAALYGYVAAIKEQVERGALNRDAVKTLFGSMQKQGALKTLFGNDATFNAIKNEMVKAAEFNAMRAIATGNSVTADKLAGGSRLAEYGADAVDAGIDLARGNLAGLVSKMLSWAGRGQSRLPDEQLLAMAKILLERDPQNFQALLGSANAGNKTAQYTILRMFEQMGAPAAAIGGANLLNSAAR